MARGKRDSKQITGQLTIADFSTDITNYVVQSNTLIGGKQNLKLNSIKLIRAAIMQVVKEDTELKPYIITIKEIAELLGVTPDHIYSDIHDIVDDIIKNPVEIKKVEKSRERWIKIPWVKRCEYNSDIGLLIILNDELEPHLLKLQKYYSRYSFQAIVGMKSIFSIRIFELLTSKFSSPDIPEEGEHVVLFIQEIREACSCMDKHLEFANFRMRVIDIAVREINEYTTYNVTYNYIKQQRKVVCIDFFVKPK